MSDIFDHGYDALESRGNDGWPTSNFKKDKLFYYSKISFDSIGGFTQKSIGLNKGDDFIWVPRKICKNLDEDDKTVYVHTEIFNKIIMENRS